MRCLGPRQYCAVGPREGPGGLRPPPQLASCRSQQTLLSACRKLILDPSSNIHSSLRICFFTHHYYNVEIEVKALKMWTRSTNQKELDKIQRSATIKSITTTTHLPCKSPQSEYVTASRWMKQSSVPCLEKRTSSLAQIWCHPISCQIYAGGSFPKNKVTGARSRTLSSIQYP